MTAVEQCIDVAAVVFAVCLAVAGGVGVARRVRTRRRWRKYAAELQVEAEQVVRGAAERAMPS